MVCDMNSVLKTKSLETSTPLRHWSARLQLRFSQSGQKTELRHCEHYGPLRVQRLFYPDDSGKAHCYLLHPPGGVVLGDELNIDVAVSKGKALLTTPSAGRFYDTAQATERQHQRLKLRVDNGDLEWLPQETILFSGANADLRTQIELGEDARLVFWDVLVLGRPACNESFDRGGFTQSLDVVRQGELLFRDRLSVNANDRVLRSAQGLAGASTIGTMLLTDQLDRSARGAWLEQVNGEQSRGDFSITQRGPLTLARYLGDCAQRCRWGFALLWEAVLDVRGESSNHPRIWHT